MLYTCQICTRKFKAEDVIIIKNKNKNIEKMIIHENGREYEMYHVFCYHCNSAKGFKNIMKKIERMS